MRTRLLRILVWAVLTSASLCLLHAHEDTLIKLKGTTLIGLPNVYAPAEFDTKAARLRIGKHAMTFPPLFKSLIDQPHDLRISASWYHVRGTLPPYILLHIHPKNKDFTYSILINLDTLDVIEFSIVLQESDSSSRELPVALTEQWRKETRDSIETLK